ncbi:hypothetical protein ACX6XY_10000 [Streptomyces sp. O3]
MQPYDLSRQQIPSMRPAQNASVGRSATPIYDQLFVEWRRSFKALPGDRTGEEDLGFTGFGSLPYGHDQHGGHSGPGGHGSLSSYGGYNSYAGYGGGQTGSWSADGRPPYTGGRPQAALPPGPRKGL